MRSRVRGSRAALAAAVLVAAFTGACAPEDAASSAMQIGFLRVVVSGGTSGQPAFVRELADAGYEVGDELSLLGADPKEVHADPAEARRVVDRWVDQGVDLIVALSSSSAAAAAEVSDEVPVLFLSNDPVATGLVASERRPEANLTGVTFRVPGDRTLAAAAAVVDPLTRVGCLLPDDDPAAEPARADLARGADALGMELVCEVFGGSQTPSDAVDRLVAAGVEAVVLVNAPGTVRALPELEPALRGPALPVVANTDTELALLVLQPDVEEIYRQLARQAVRLLEGTPVADVPVEDPAEFSLIVHLGVAQRLGIDIPEEIRAAADLRR